MVSGELSDKFQCYPSEFFRQSLREFHMLTANYYGEVSEPPKKKAKKEKKPAGAVPAVN